MTTTEEIIRVAKSVGLPLALYGSNLQRFYRAAYAAGLEAGAERCMDTSNESGGDQYNMFGKDLAEQCAAALREMAKEVRG